MGPRVVLNVGGVRSEGMIEGLRALPPVRTVVATLVFAGIAALVIGIPSDLIDTRFFGRPIDTRPIDYVILAVTSLLIGLIFAIRMPNDIEVAENQTLFGSLVSFLAVGCPVCNQFVVAAVGTSGALTWWAPVQPVVGLLAIGLLLFALKRRLETYRLAACPLPRTSALTEPQLQSS